MAWDGRWILLLLAAALVILYQQGLITLNSKRAAFSRLPWREKRRVYILYRQDSADFPAQGGEKVPFFLEADAVQGHGVCLCPGAPERAGACPYTRNTLRGSVDGEGEALQGENRHGPCHRQL